MVKRIVWLLSVAVLLTMIGCTLTTSLDGLSGGKRPDGGSDASMDAPADGPDAACGADYVAAVLADEPAVFYPLDDHGPVAADRSGHGLDGTYGAEVKTRAPGLLPDGCDFGAEFPGGTMGAYPKSVQTPGDPRLEPTTGITIEAWIKLSQLPLPSDASAPNPAIVVYADGSGVAVYTMDIFGPKATLDLYLTTAASPGVSFQTTKQLKTDRVYYVVGTYDGQTAKLYLDGQLETKQSHGGGQIFGYSVNTLYLGDNPPFTVRPAFDGTIENVAIYGKALSAARIAAHYQAAGN